MVHYISISRGFGDDMFICDVSCLGQVQYQRDQGGLAMCLCNRVYCIHVPGHDPLILSFQSFSFCVRWGFYGPHYLRY